MAARVGGVGLSIEAPTLEFGDGRIEGLGDLLDDHGMESVLVVSDDGVDEAGILDRAMGSVTADVTRMTATTEPSVADFADLPSGGFDAVVAVGGGSCLDTAKVAALLLSHGGSPAEYIGEGAVPGPVRPVVAVPTTSGTGSQATQSAVLSFEGVKRGISDEVLRPDIALVDPTVTVDLPPAITARSGFDAFVHALESWLARDYQDVPARSIRYQGANPVTRPLSKQALTLVHSSLETAVDDGKALEARRAMSLGSHLAGVAFSNAGLGAVHALASTVGGMTGRPHGECLGASLAAGLEYNRPVREQEYAHVSRHLGVADPGTPDEAAADSLVTECLRLAAVIGLPTSLTGVGLSGGDIDEVVENTLIQERRLKTNPRAVTAEELRRALETRLG